MEMLDDIIEKKESKILDASSLAADEKLDGRNYSGYMLIGDFSRRKMIGTILVEAILDGCVLYGAVLRFADLRGAKLWHVDARRADLRGASLAGARVTGLRLCRALLECTRFAGSYGGPPSREHVELNKPEVKALPDGTWPPMEPLAKDAKDAKSWKDEPPAGTAVHTQPEACMATQLGGRALHIVPGT